MHLYPAKALFGPCRDQEPSKEGTDEHAVPSRDCLVRQGATGEYQHPSTKSMGSMQKSCAAGRGCSRSLRQKKNLLLSFYCITFRGRCQDLLVHLKKALPRSGCNTKHSARKLHQILPDREKQVRSLQCREEITNLHHWAPDSQERPFLLSSIGIFGDTSSFNPAQFQLLSICHEPWLREWETRILCAMICCRGSAVSPAILLEAVCQSTSLLSSPILRHWSQASQNLKHGAGLWTGEAEPSGQ